MLLTLKVGGGCLSYRQKTESLKWMQSQKIKSNPPGQDRETVGLYPWMAFLQASPLNVKVWLYISMKFGFKRVITRTFVVLHRHGALNFLLQFLPGL